MTVMGVVHILLYFGVVLALTKPIGAYMFAVFEGTSTISKRVFSPVERVVYRRESALHLSEVGDESGDRINRPRHRQPHAERVSMHACARVILRDADQAAAGGDEELAIRVHAGCRGRVQGAVQGKSAGYGAGSGMDYLNPSALCVWRLSRHCGCARQ